MRRANGFTLVETAVALAVFALAALTLVKLQGGMLRDSGDIAGRVTAGIVAENLAVEAITDPRPPAPGTAAGVAINAGQSWRWRREVRSVPAPLGVAGIAVAIEVFDPRGNAVARRQVLLPAS